MAALLAVAMLAPLASSPISATNYAQVDGPGASDTLALEGTSAINTSGDRSATAAGVTGVMIAISLGALLGLVALYLRFAVALRAPALAKQWKVCAARSSAYVSSRALMQRSSRALRLQRSTRVLAAAATTTGTSVPTDAVAAPRARVGADAVGAGGGAATFSVAHPVRFDSVKRGMETAVDIELSVSSTTASPVSGQARDALASHSSRISLAPAPVRVTRPAGSGHPAL